MKKQELASHKSVSERRTQYPRRSLTRRSGDGVLRVRCGSHPCAPARRGGKRALGAWFNLSRCSLSREPPGAKPEARQRQRQANAPIGAKRDRHSRLLGAFGDDEIGDRTDQSKVSGKVGTHRHDLPSPAGIRQVRYERLQWPPMRCSSMLTNSAASAMPRPLTRI